jgi:hypothetical protein
VANGDVVLIPTIPCTNKPSVGAAVEYKDEPIVAFPAIPNREVAAVAPPPTPIEPELLRIILALMSVFVISKIEPPELVRFRVSLLLAPEINLPNPFVVSQERKADDCGAIPTPIFPAT